MLGYLRRSIIIAVFFAVAVFIYAFVATGVSQALFGHQANGSLTANGSTMIGQTWSSNRWFHGRPDDTGPYAADPKATPPVAGGDNPLVANGSSGESGASNLGPRSKVLLNNTKELIAYWHARGVNPTPDLVTTSASGLDPDITPEDAIVQIPMVSRATGITPARLRALIHQKTHGQQWGFLGSKYVNVLELNEGLAKLR
ncbi:MAG: potassium-transporting ATPase subunit C [Acidimicrobiaceae bacterium]|nr:potassium-transporting ATPase subunit C [Acidimicrobiaceae bacterium]